MSEPATLRIGELSRRVGLSPDLLRAWERRYELLRPVRSDGGYRLYSEADEWRLRVMKERLAAGLSPAQAAATVAELEHRSGAQEDASGDRASALGHELAVALEGFDEPLAHTILDRLFGIFGLERTIRDVILPYLRRLGERWERGEVTVAQEHFASHLLEGRLLELARGWNRGPGPSAVLACPPGEAHTLPLVCFGLVLRQRGWRNIYLGADTPINTVHLTAETVEADVLVLAAVTHERFTAVADELRALSRKHRVLLAGTGVGPELAASLGVEYLRDEPVTAAQDLAISTAAAVAG